MGAALARAWFAGVIGGFGETMYNQTQTTSIDELGYSISSTTDTDDATKQALQAGVGQGLLSSSQKLSDFYITLAENTLPILETGAARDVTVVFKEAFTIEIKDKES